MGARYDVDAGAEQKRRAARSGIAPDLDADALGQVAVPACGQRDAGGKSRRRLGIVGADGPIAHAECGNPQAWERRGTQDAAAREQRYLLLQGHAGDGVVDPLFSSRHRLLRGLRPRRIWQDNGQHEKNSGCRRSPYRSAGAAVPCASAVRSSLCKKVIRRLWHGASRGAGLSWISRADCHRLCDMQRISSLLSEECSIRRANSADWRNCEILDGSIGAPC